MIFFCGAINKEKLIITAHLNILKKISLQGYGLSIYDGKSLGVYKTIEEAYYAQTKKKKEEILRVVNDYKNIIPIEVYEAIVKYEFSIENDRNYKRVS